MNHAGHGGPVDIENNQNEVYAMDMNHAGHGGPVDIENNQKEVYAI